MRDQLLYRVGEAADALGCSRAQTYKLIADGVIPSIRIGNVLRVPVTALRERIEQKLAEKRHDATPQPEASR